ncbi:Oidioi.mRNA.OKI2018_I69.PAR.g9329.t1.cds [Oikopleura dioica]|uniref:Oidioi.mRNA.OKI2018_I69.PAR.g9329.t1.cds n=1 Tax=Oikopleura dioica TaxID=34765 RepID=A0ABN7RSP5_OIKDI|nr:Oidioi.mRNA.OKI2018_I69.PAR.g9329.t1.cds [Oikopleura dioica]
MSTLQEIPEDNRDEKKEPEISIVPIKDPDEIIPPCTVVYKILLAIGFLYIFIVSLGILSSAFQVLGGASLNRFLVDYQDTLSNPLCGLIIGIIVTVVVQSSSTSTSIIITMVGARILTVPQAIYMVMGCNVGTSITSTLVAFGNATQRAEFGRAIASAVVLSMYNLLTAVVLLPLEMAFQPLHRLTAACVLSIDQANTSAVDEINNPIETITGPLKSKIIAVNKAALGDEYYNGSFVAYCGKTISSCATFCGLSDERCIENNEDACLEADQSWSCSWNERDNVSSFLAMFGENCARINDHIFTGACYSDTVVGLCTVALALVIMFYSLAMIVRSLKSVLSGHINRIIREYIDKDLPGIFRPLTDYIYVIVGILMTVAVQSSSIVCAVITPLCGIGVISLERAYSLIVGCCIGTTTTGLIAALANLGDGFAESMQVSLAHLFFNMVGLLLWFIVPVARRLPIRLALWAGAETEKYRWWAFCYIIGLFVAIPGVLFLLVFIIILTVVVINHLRDSKPEILPEVIRDDWKILPIWLRSLKPYDDAFCNRAVVAASAVRSRTISRSSKGARSRTVSKNETGVVNEAYQRTKI